jgi:hypothetical protein
MSEELTGWKMRSGLMARVHMNSNVRKINKISKTSLPQTIWVGEISVQIEPDTKRDTKRVHLNSRLKHPQGSPSTKSAKPEPKRRGRPRKVELVAA